MEKRKKVVLAIVVALFAGGGGVLVAGRAQSPILSHALAFISGWAIGHLLFWGCLFLINKYKGTKVKDVEQGEVKLPDGSVISPSNISKVSVVRYANPLVVGFVFPQAIGPDCSIGYGIFGMNLRRFQEGGNCEDFNPLGVDVERAFGLCTAVRQRVLGVTEDICVKGHELQVEIAECHSLRKDEVLREIEAVIEDFLDGRLEAEASVEESGGEPDTDLVPVSDSEEGAKELNHDFGPEG